jgi:hypothetical protein
LGEKPLSTKSISQKPYSVNNDPFDFTEQNIPQEMRERDQWLLWTGSYDAKGKLSKRPNGSSTNPATWTTFADASSRAKKLQDFGIGYVLTEDDSHVGIDLDGCRDPQTGEVDSWAEEIVSRCASYYETSPSGTGVKIIVHGALPKISNHVKKLGNGRSIEIYDRGRFFTVTGNGPKSGIADAQDLIDGLVSTHFKQRGATLRDQQRRERTPLSTEQVQKAAEIVAEHMPDSYRNEFCMAVAGYLERRTDEDSAFGVLDTAWILANAYVERKTHDELYNIVYRYTPERLENGGAVGGPKMEEHAPGILRDLDLIFPKNSNNGTINSPSIIIGMNLPSYSVDELNEMAREETPWVIEGIAAKGAVTDFYGPAKHGGKTTFITHACASIVDGLPFIGRNVSKERVLYLTEMAPDNFKDYLQNATIRKGDDFRTVFKKDVWDVPWDALIEAAGQKCANEGRGVLVVDTFAEFSGIRGTEENNAGDVHEKLSALRKVAQGHDLAVILIRHANKEGKGRGSSAFEASVDIVIGYKRPDKANSESYTRTIDAVGRWNESNFTTNLELTPDGFTDCGDDKHVKFNKAVRAIKAAAPLGEDRALKRDAFAVEGVSQASVDNALEWLVDKGELITTGAGKKGDPIRFYVPVTHSNNDPGPISAPLLETAEEEDASSEVLSNDPWLWEEVYDPRTKMMVPRLLLENVEIPEPVGPDPEPHPSAVAFDRTITIDLADPDDDPTEVRVWEPIKEEAANAALAYKAIQEIREDWAGYELPTDAEWWASNLEANGIPFTLDAVEMALAA